jgi:type II secretory pathway component PulM
MNYWKWATFVLGAVLAIVVGWGTLVRPAEGGERQPHMRAALVNLRSAKAQLEKAEPDKGGHRMKAMDLTQQAIDEVQKGIDADAQSGAIAR